MEVTTSKWEMCPRYLIRATSRRPISLLYMPLGKCKSAGHEAVAIWGNKHVDFCNDKPTDLVTCSALEGPIWYVIARHRYPMQPYSELYKRVGILWSLASGALKKVFDLLR
jgi:hypothetical protein